MMSHKHSWLPRTVSKWCQACQVEFCTSFETNFYRIAGTWEVETSVIEKAECLLDKKVSFLKWPPLKKRDITRTFIWKMPLDPPQKGDHLSQSISGTPFSKIVYPPWMLSNSQKLVHRSHAKPVLCWSVSGYKVFGKGHICSWIKETRLRHFDLSTFNC